MNRSALKNFATSARKELLKKIESRALKLGIAEHNIQKAEIESSDAIFIDGKPLSKEEKNQRDNLIARIHQLGFNQVLEEVAYTWFNRFTALRYMEVNDFLPTGMRVLSSSNPNSAEPDMLNKVFELDLEIDQEYVYDLKLNNKTEELFKYLLIKHCNDLNRFLPFMFETIDDYTEILFPEGMLAKESFLHQMVDTELIPEDNWQKVEVIGWLYQYYIAEEKDRVIKEKKKYKTEEIPFATQLFTPDWIVRYMVQNSLGRYWIESHPEHRELLKDWEFYLKNQEEDFAEKLAPYINKELKAEDIKCFDPAMGSGHILVYMFDILYEIYSKCGYMEREIPRLILENNLYGLDIDDRAYQLACFSVVMKALEYNGRFFRSIEREGLELNLVSIQQSNEIGDEDISYIAGDHSDKNYDKVKGFINQFRDAKTIGSLLKVDVTEYDFIKNRIKHLKNTPSTDLFDFEKKERLVQLMDCLLKQASIMAKKYDIFVSNPPYVGNNYLNKEAADFLSKHYSDVKSDLFSAFMEYSFSATKEYGLIGFMTPFVWMFISSYEKLRQKVIDQRTISSFIQLEYSAFEEATVPICTFTLRNYTCSLNGEYIRLSNFKGAQSQPIKTLEAVQNPHVPYRYSYRQDNFKKIPGNPIAFWVSENVSNIFMENKSLEHYATACFGMRTGDNKRFLRYWHEIEWNKMGVSLKSAEGTINSNIKWIPYCKGGEFRKWYGNNEYVVNWGNNGYEIKENTRLVYPQLGDNLGWKISNEQYYFKSGITWSRISSSHFGVRYLPKGFIFDSNGSMLFADDDKQLYLLGFLCSKLADYFVRIINSTLAIQISSVSKIPIIFDETKTSQINKIVKELIAASEEEWNQYEISWDFKKHPFLRYKKAASTLKESYGNWEKFSNDTFAEIKTKEEELNRIFIDIYGLQSDLAYELDENDVTVRKADVVRDVKSFLSYALGCSFGRYSLDEEGLMFAGGKFDPYPSQSFKADEDNIIPILTNAYFEDDLLSKLIMFIEVTFGEDTLAENIDFIADTLGKKKGETAKETILRYFLNDFYKDHLQIYKKRPIYWLFTSGKQKAFNCLVYMHRYDKTTLSRIRMDYLHQYQFRLDAEKKDLLHIIEGDYSAKEISSAKKELKLLDKKIEECKVYDELLHHMADQQIVIDLDDGAAVNYEKFAGLVAKI
jgi:hypothetical protein